MVNYIEAYKELLQRAAEVFEALIRLYSPDKHVENDWADVTLAETRIQRNGMLERLANPTKISAAYTNTLILSIGHYLDSHWADYQNLPIASPEKRTQVEREHTELEAIIKEIAKISIALR